MESQLVPFDEEDPAQETMICLSSSDPDDDPADRCLNALRRQRPRLFETICMACHAPFHEEIPDTDDPILNLVNELLSEALLREQ